MSGNRLSLKSPPVVAVVLCLLAVVVIVNIRTFTGKRPVARRQAAAQARDYPALPGDLQQIMERSAVPSAVGAGLGGGGSMPALGRDPFARPVKVPPRPAEPRSADLRTGRRPDSLYCEAVMLGGRRPSALIDGESRAVGERVRGRVIVSIGTEGVSLQGVDGERIFLSVGLPDELVPTYRMVNGSPESPSPDEDFREESSTERRTR